MKTTITLRLDTELVRKLRVLAAEQAMSISQLIAQRLADMVRGRKAYAAARKRALRRLHEGLLLEWRRTASRDELHER